MKKKLNLLLILTCVFSLLLIINEIINLNEYIRSYLAFKDASIPVSPRYIIKESIFLTFSITLFVLLIISLLKISRADLSELLSSTKEKRLAKKEAKRQEKLSELEAKKEELENQINSIKNNEESQK